MASKPFAGYLSKPLVFQVGHFGKVTMTGFTNLLSEMKDPDFLQMNSWGYYSKLCTQELDATRGNTMHYLLHGCHHKHPMDALQLVFLPAATAILSVPILSSPPVAPALFGGGLLGYVMYDCTHYFLHHGNPSKVVAKNLKRYHMKHHLRIQNNGFEITSPVWDKVFGTIPTN